MKKTHVAQAAELACRFWHHLKQLNGIVYQANTFFLATGIMYI